MQFTFFFSDAHEDKTQLPVPKEGADERQQKSKLLRRASTRTYNECSAAGVVGMSPCKFSSSKGG
jgi:hypothetical protein